MKQLDREKMLIWKQWIPLFSAVILLFSALPYLGRPLWFDEVLTLGWLALDFSRVPFTYPIPNNHIVYTMLLWLWNWFAGYDFFFLRLLSLLGGAAAVFLISRRLILRCGLLPGFCGSVLLAVSGCMIQFSTALRGYIFALLFCFAAFLTAEIWIRRGIWSRYGIFYFIFCCLAVGVMPTCLFVLCGQALFFVPRMLRSRKEFLHVCLLGFLPVPALLVSYAHIFDQLWRASQLREGWESWPGAYWNLYGSWLFLIFPVLAFALWGAGRLWTRFPRLRLRLICFGAIFLLPLFLAFPAKVPPFPRVFFPFFGIWIVILTTLLIPFARYRYRSLHSLLLFSTLLWLALVPSVTPPLSAFLFGGPRADDLLHPYPMSSAFVPDRAAEFICKAGADSPVFIDFAADPPSLSLMLMARNFPEERILYDRPDRGPVSSLDPYAWIVCTGPEAEAKIRKRFGLKGDYACVFRDGMQKVYRKQ